MEGVRVWHLQGRLCGVRWVLRRIGVKGDALAVRSFRRAHWPSVVHGERHVCRAARSPVGSVSWCSRDRSRLRHGHAQVLQWREKRSLVVAGIMPGGRAGQGSRAPASRYGVETRARKDEDEREQEQEQADVRARGSAWRRVPHTREPPPFSHARTALAHTLQNPVRASTGMPGPHSPPVTCLPTQLLPAMPESAAI